jgi:hypothetical protein
MVFHHVLTARDLMREANRQVLHSQRLGLAHQATEEILAARNCGAPESIINPLLQECADYFLESGKGTKNALKTYHSAFTARSEHLGEMTKQMGSCGPEVTLDLEEVTVVDVECGPLPGHV